jgi:dihydrofolate reductase
MRKVIASVFVSLDGVMQAPGGPDEDRSGGFELGGWLPPFAEEGMGERLARLFQEPFDLLLGRRTYDIFAAYWPHVNGPDDGIGAKFDRAAKFVLTRSERPLDWQNSHRLPDLDALAELRRGDGPDLIVQGSTTLYPQLLSAGLLDRLTLMAFPLVLGHGKRLFGDGTVPQTLRLVEHEVSAKGAIIATYEPAGPVETGSFVSPDASEAELARRKKVEEGSW